MKIVALMAWYNEDPSMLWRAVRSLEGVADHLIAVDGAYALFPGGKPRSPRSQHEEIDAAATEAGIKATIVTPKTVWEHNEVEKRSFMFAEGEKITTPEDWYLIMDADDYVISLGGFQSVLWRTPHDVAAVKLLARTGGSHTAFRKLFRALPGLRVEGAHYVFKHGNRYLWGNTAHHRLEPCADATMLEIVHDPDARPQHRQQTKTEYYRRRDGEQAEYIPVRGGRRILPA